MKNWASFASAASYLIALGAQLSGYTSVSLAIFFLLVATVLLMVAGWKRFESNPQRYFQIAGAILCLIGSAVIVAPDAIALVPVFHPLLAALPTDLPIYAACITAVGAASVFFGTMRRPAQPTAFAPVAVVAHEPLGQFSRLQISHDVLDFGENYGGRQSVLKLILPFAFNTSCEACTISITSVYANLGPGGYYMRRRHSWFSSEHKKRVPGSEENIVLAYIAQNPAHHGYYGDFPASRSYLASHSDHVITVRVEEGPHIQTKILLVRVPGTKISSREDGGIDQGNRFFIQESGKSIFDPMDVDQASDAQRPLGQHIGFGFWG